MRSRRTFLNAVALATLVLGHLPANAKESCSNATLNGSYGVIASGTIVGVGLVALIGVFNYDGAGKMSGTVIQKVNGNNVQVTFTGIYSVDQNCVVSDVANIS